MTNRTLAAKDALMAKQLYSFRFDPELIKEIDKLAKAENRNLTNFIETLLIKRMEEQKKTPKK